MRYIVRDTHIRRGDRTYGPGEVIDLTGEEACPMGHHLEPIESGETPPDDGEDAEEGKKRRKQ